MTLPEGKPRPALRGASEREIVRVGSAPGEAAREMDSVVVEEPLEIRVDGDPLATTMRTPGHDRELALGFLHAEGVLRSRDDVGSVTHCGRPGDEGYGNVIDVVSAAGARLAFDRIEASRRGTLTSASCGVCGRRTIDDMLAWCPSQHSQVHVVAGAILEALEAMRGAQALFARTGGLHGAGAFGQRGAARVVREDVGRHNAVDKVVGALLLEPALAAGVAMLVVSGRASFEIVQKAAVAGIPIVASVSAVSSLAIDLAEKTGTTLVGFARDGRMNVYAGVHRIDR